MSDPLLKPETVIFEVSARYGLSKTLHVMLSFANLYLAAEVAKTPEHLLILAKAQKLVLPL